MLVQGPDYLVGKLNFPTTLDKYGKNAAIVSKSGIVKQIRLMLNGRKDTDSICLFKQIEIYDDKI